MVKSGFVCFVFMVFVFGTLAAQDQRSAEKSQQVVLKYLGTAGWEITDGTTSILIDPYLSRINGPAPPGGGSGHSLAGDTRRAYGWGDVASSDVAAIDWHIHRADCVLVTHTQYDGRPIRRQTVRISFVRTLLRDAVDTRQARPVDP